MARLIFDPFHNVQDFTLVLAHRNLDFYGALNNVTDIRYRCNMNTANEMTFVLHKYADDIREPLWDEVLDLRLIYVKDLDEYFECEVSIDDTTKDVTKTVTCTSLCEAELSQFQVNGFYVNDEDDIADFTQLHPKEDYNVTKFYNIDNVRFSLMHRLIQNYAPDYKIGHIDESLKGLQRSFSVDSSSVYEFLTKDMAEQFNCIFKFDSTTRTISAYDLYSVCENPNCDWLKSIEYWECQNSDCQYFKTNHLYYKTYTQIDVCPHCNQSEWLHREPHNIPYRGEFTDKCPKCGESQIKSYGTDTTVLIDKDNFTDSINFTTDTDSIKNTFRVVGGDENITIGIRNVNPTGSDRVVYFSEEQKNDMPEDLVERWNDYYELVESYRPDYRSHVLELQNALDQINYYTHSMMPTREDTETSAREQYDNLITSLRAYPPAVEKLTGTTSVATVTSTLKTYAKTYLKSGYYKLDIYRESYSNGDWYGVIVVTNYSDDSDVYPEGNPADMTRIRLSISSDYEKFIEQRVQRVMYQEDSRKENEDNNILDVISLKSLLTFRNAITFYSLKRLESFKAALETVQNTLYSLRIAEEEKMESAEPFNQYTTKTCQELYDEFYVPVLKKLVMLNGGIIQSDWINEQWVDDSWKSSRICPGELNTRQATIDYYTQIKDESQEWITNIQASLNIKENLGDEYYKLLCNYTREQDYSNDNFISDNLSNGEIYEKCRELVEHAEIDIVKSAEYQHSITANLSDLLVIEEFIPFLDSFEVGNFIRVRSDEQLYRLRLISYEINFDDVSKINVEFSDMTRTALGMNDIGSILAAANTMAGSYGYVKKQSETGIQANKIISDFREFGLTSADYKIKSNINEETIIDNNGIFLKNFNNETETYNPEQVRITHNIIAFTDDGWYHTKMAMGKFSYVDEFNTPQEGYGVNADFCVSSFIDGSTIVAGKLYSREGDSYNTKKTVIDLDNGTFRLGESDHARLTFDGDNLVLGEGTRIEAGKIVSKNNYNNGTTEDSKYAVFDLDHASFRLGTAAHPALTFTQSGGTASLVLGEGTILSAGKIVSNAGSSDDDKNVLIDLDNEIFRIGPAGDNNYKLLYENGTFKFGSGVTLTWDNLSSDAQSRISGAASDAVEAFKAQVNNVLGTQIGDSYIISPRIGGGYLYIAGNNGSVEINPQAYYYNGTNSTYRIFNVRNSTGKLVMGVDTSGNAMFRGKMLASEGFIGKLSDDDDDPTNNYNAGLRFTHMKLFGGKHNDDTYRTITVQRPILYANESEVAPDETMRWTFASGGKSHSNYSDCSFRVDKFGNLYCKSLHIENRASGSTTTSGEKEYTYSNAPITSSSLSNYLTTSAASSTYLKLTGGTIRGNISMSDSANSEIYFPLGTRICGGSHDIAMVWRYDTGKNVHNIVTAIGCNAYYTHLYGKSHIFAGSSVTNYVLTTENIGSSGVSDERLKYNINSLDDYDKYEKLFYLLSPISFKYKEKVLYDESSKIQFGFSAQKTIDAFNSIGLNWKDYGVVIEREREDEIDNVKKIIPDNLLALDKTNLIALNTHMIQKHKEEIDKLSEENKTLRERLMILENKVNILLNKGE